MTVTFWLRIPEEIAREISADLESIGFKKNSYSDDTTVEYELKEKFDGKSGKSLSHTVSWVLHTLEDIAQMEVPNGDMMAYIDWETSDVEDAEKEEVVHTVITAYYNGWTDALRYYGIE
jgi:hypothetical protein